MSILATRGLKGKGYLGLAYTEESDTWRDFSCGEEALAQQKHELNFRGKYSLHFKGRVGVGMG
jgi:hypothetical protein